MIVAKKKCAFDKTLTNYAIILHKINDIGYSFECKRKCRTN